MNALTKDMLAALDAVFADFEADKESWVAILTATGDRSFCTGMDLKEAIPLLTAGDGWHHNHHVFPTSIRHGLLPGQVDPSYGFCRGLQRLVLGRHGSSWIVRRHGPTAPPGRSSWPSPSAVARSVNES